MKTNTMLYHPTIAPKGKIFESLPESPETMAEQGWVDNPAKIGIDVQGGGQNLAMNKLRKGYRRGEIPGIEEAGNMTSIKCAIWGTIGCEEFRYDGDGRSMESPRAGGRYSISGTAATVLNSRSERVKARLTSWLIEQRKLGAQYPNITTSTIADAKDRRNLEVHERADRLLQNVANQTSILGDFTSFTGPNVFCPAMAWSESVETVEVEFLLNYLETRGWLERSNDFADSFTLTVDGYARLSDLDRSDSASSQAFVAMWFHESMTEAWKNGIKPGIEDAGFKAMRIDKKEHFNKIDDEIIAEIRRSRFLVADFTQGSDGARGGVYYEAGFAHGLDIPVIFLCRKDELDKLHFDTRQYNHIDWETPDELRRRLAVRISAQIGDGPHQSAPQMMPASEHNEF